jgi:hypothetical protein
MCAQEGCFRAQSVNAVAQQGDRSAPELHSGLIAELAASGPADEYFDSKVHVLSEMIKHHVKEEEQPDGMFAKAKKSKMDLQKLGAELLQRKHELMTH